MQPILIGLCGFAGTGKDSISDVLVAQGFHTKAFADNPRTLALKLDPYFPELNKSYRQILNEMGYEQAKRQHVCIREYLIKLGDSVCAVLGPNTWVDSALPVDMQLDKDLVVRDIRKAIEAERVRAHGGVVWRIVRPQYGPAHETEALGVGSVDPDFVLTNDGTLEDLKAKVLQQLEKMRQPPPPPQPPRPAKQRKMQPLYAEGAK